MMNTDPIAVAVRAEMQAQQLDQAVLARAADVPESALASFLERGGEFSTAKLARVADALGLDDLALLDGHRKPLLRPSVFLRHAASWQDYSDQDTAVLDAALQQARAFRDIRGALGAVPLVGFPRTDAPARPAQAARAGYALAARLRSALGLALDVAVPDIRALVEDRLGVLVLVRPLKTAGATAMTVCAPDGVAALVLNSEDVRRRENNLLARVHLAHETCHALFDPVATGRLNLVLEREGSEAASANEQRAGAFAAEFLMPEAGLGALLGSPRKSLGLAAAEDVVQQVRANFGVPREIAVFHLHHRRFLTDALRDQLKTGKAPNVGHKTSLPEPGGPSIAATELARRAMDEALISSGAARLALGIHALEPLPWLR
ncbi:MAG: ImmA/IrrE family metallo-endopeptidase [Deltaproteobacteria bacterium]|nr:ImmA/IrrE family metallo-endopeptidase [Deltaproteobacteria bacterium]